MNKPEKRQELQQEPYEAPRVEELATELGPAQTATGPSNVITTEPPV